MPSPTTTQGLLGIFLRGADTPTTNPRATTLPVPSPTSSSLWVILADRAMGRSARGRVRGRKGPHEEGGGVNMGRGTEQGRLGKSAQQNRDGA